jgi:hypothetical protein
MGEFSYTPENHNFFLQKWSIDPKLYFIIKNVCWEELLSAQNLEILIPKGTSHTNSA